MPMQAREYQIHFPTYALWIPVITIPGDISCEERLASILEGVEYEIVSYRDVEIDAGYGGGLSAAYQIGIEVNKLRVAVAKQKQQGQ